MLDAWGSTEIATVILSVGALGTAAFGIVEGFKWTSIGALGFERLKQTLGPIWETLRVAYGHDYEELLRAQYRGDQDELVRTLRQGVRVGLTADNAETIAEFLETIDPETLRNAATFVSQPLEPNADVPPEMRNILGRYELAADSRVDAAMTLAKSHYMGKLRLLASAVSIVIATAVGAILFMEDAKKDYTVLILAVLIGIAAVPLAPIAKDLSSAVQSAAQALRRKR